MLLFRCYLKTNKNCSIYGDLKNQVKRIWNKEAKIAENFEITLETGYHIA